MSHDHCDCVERLEEYIVWQRGQLAEQDARGLRLAGEVETWQRAAKVDNDRWHRAECGPNKAVGGLMHEREGLREAAQGALEYFEANSGLNKDMERYHENQLRNALSDSVS